MKLDGVGAGVEVGVRAGLGVGFGTGVGAGVLVGFIPPAGLDTINSIPVKLVTLFHALNLT